MRRGGREVDLRVTSMKLGARFVLWNTLALALVMLLAALVLYTGATRIAENRTIDTISRAVRLNFENPEYEQVPGTAARHAQTGVERFPVLIDPAGERVPGVLYRYREKDTLIRDELRFMVPYRDGLGRNMLGMIVGILIVVVLVGAGVALWASNQVSRPIQRLVEDVRQISKGDLAHRTRAVGTGEVELLARSIDRMTRDLQAAQDAEIELSVREREMELATDVREALLPLATPLVEGYDVGAAHLSSTSLGGDFHDFIERPDGRLGLLVCGVSGQGVPAALIGATARSYLRSELSGSDDVETAFQRVNRWLAADVRRGMFVTALYALIEPQAGRARVVCAGHRLPLLRFAAEDGTLRMVQPEGIALGFDKGPVFDRRLQLADVPLAAGDRLVLANNAPVAMTNAEGRELGEKAFYARVLKHAPQPTTTFLKALRRDLEHFAGNTVQADVSIVTISRNA